MKTLIALALALTASAPAFADRGPIVPGVPAMHPVLTAHVSPGFVMNPQDRQFTLTNDGTMTLVVRTLRENKIETLQIGKLSAEMMKKVEAKIAAIDPNAKLVDAEEGKPECTDTPFYSTEIYQAGVTKVISRTGGCHEYSIADYGAQSLSYLANTYLNF